jgi:Kef-type K+ transport system membrane component KefB
VIDAAFSSHPQLILLIGSVIILTVLLKSGLERLGVPSLVGFIALGFLLNLAHLRFDVLAGGGRELFRLLAEVGVFTLMFRIGLESDIVGLLQQLRRASAVWLGGVAASAALGYATAAWVLGLALLPSLFVAIALSATSVGVSVALWHEAGALGSPTGKLLLVLAELDDISGILLMALLLAVAPVLLSGQGEGLWFILGQTGGLLLLKLAVFLVLCYGFAVLFESRVTGFFRHCAAPPAAMLLVSGMGIVIASLAGLLGLSIAVGAFFAGLVFSRDPASDKIDASFTALYELFTPFFFVGIGLLIDPRGLDAALWLGLALLAAAVLGKSLGHGLPTLRSAGWSGAVLVGVSMVPRAEIAMIVMEQGLNLGEWAVPPEVYSAMVLVSAATCLITPLAVRRLLHRWPEMAG